MGENSEFSRILDDTEFRIKKSQYAHWRARDVLDAYALWSTVANVAGGAVVSAVSATLITPGAPNALFGVDFKLVLLCAGAGVSVVSILQSVLKWSERAQSHFLAANAYSSLRREIEVLRLAAADGGDATAQLEVIILKLRDLSETAPPVPAGLWNRAVRGLTK